MNNSKSRTKHFNCPFRMESVVRIYNYPLVESGVKTAGGVINVLKKNSQILNWSFETAESVVLATIDSLRPAAKLIEGPINRIDTIVCHGLDMVEKRVPVQYPPQMVYLKSKEFMSDRLVRPVVKRANSVKQLGTAVLDSRVSSYAADRIDGALTAADKYIDKYLPTEQDQVDGANSCAEDTNNSKAVNTFHKGQRVSRKLKRRLTERTIAEARALKKQSKEAIHILIYAAELIVTDPKLALEKARELWAYLSKDEPENQAPPHTLEQLIILITRESARRLVHLVNFSNRHAARLPRSALISIRMLIHRFGYITESMLKLVHLDKANALALQESTAMVVRLQTAYRGLQQYTSTSLDRLVALLMKRIENAKEQNEKQKQQQSHEKNSSSSSSSSASSDERATKQQKSAIQHNNQINNNPSTHNNVNGGVY